MQWTDDPAQWGIKQLKSVPADGLSITPGVIHQGRNSGYQAIGLAFGELKAERIILLGFDMSTSHWFGDHPKEIGGGLAGESFIQNFNTIDPAKYGIEIINCSRQTALTCFPQMALEEL